MAGSGSDKASDWASMPTDILILIAERLVPEVSDHIRFAAVCKDWYSAARSVTHTTRFFPQLLIPNKNESDMHHRSWYNAMEKRVVDCRLHIPYDKRCCGSSHGWLIFVEESLALTLFNPFLGSTIHLPPVISAEEKKRLKKNGRLYMDHDYFIKKVVLSGDPSIDPENYEVLALYEGDLAYFRCGMRSWIHMKVYGGWSAYEEITYFNGKFYVANLTTLVCLDICWDDELEYKRISITQRELLRRSDPGESVYKVYLVGTPYGDLLWVDRMYVHKFIGISRDNHGEIVEYFETGEVPEILENWILYHFTSHFTVYKVDKEFIEVNNMDNQVLFVGHNDSELVSTRNFPKYKANCIYYMDDRLPSPFIEDNDIFLLGAMDTSCYDLKDQSCEPLEQAAAWGKGYTPPPIWILLPKAKLELNF